MVSLSSPMRRMRAKASLTLIYFLRSINSAVIMLPAESSGYWRYWLMRFLVSGVAARITRLTTLAGSSPSISTASSTYSSSTMPASSESVIALMIFSCSGASKLAKTSAAVSFESRRNTSGMRASSISVRNSATSNSFISSRRSRRALASCRSSSSISSSLRCSCSVS